MVQYTFVNSFVGLPDPRGDYFFGGAWRSLAEFLADLGPAPGLAPVHQTPTEEKRQGEPRWRCARRQTTALWRAPGAHGHSTQHEVPYQLGVLHLEQHEKGLTSARYKELYEQAMSLESGACSRCVPQSLTARALHHTHHE